jgi:hypothetical protein
MKSLTGKGKPFHSSLDKAAALLKRKVGTGQEFMKELQGLGGIKQAEIDERKLAALMGMPKMTHEQFLAELANRPVPAIGEKVLGGNDRGPKDEAPYHGEYTLPGGENYREMLIKAPKGNDDFAGVGAHFGGEGNILASMRLKDRMTPEGQKLLHLEELQSDWHQQGREKGYKSDLPNLSEDEMTRREQLASKIRKGLATSAEIDEQNALRDRLSKIYNAVPDAPFKKNWEEMALKRLIHHAAEKGYHGIVVTPGAEQADRFDLSKHVDELAYWRDGDRIGLSATGPHGTVFDQDYYSAEDLPSVVGRELADKILSGEGSTKSTTGFPEYPDVTFLSQEGLRVGGEGMKGFYDKKVPNILNAIGKKHGVKTQLHGHHIETRPAKVTPQIAAPGIGHFPEPIVEPAQTKALHHFPITEDMRKDILTNGLPLYADGGIIRKAEGGNVQLSVEQMRQQLMAAGKNLPDLTQIGAQEAPSMPVKNFIPVNNGATGPMPMGGVDMSPQQPGQQMLPASLMQPQQPQGAPQGQPSPLGSTGSPPPQGGSNILQMTQQGQALNAMKPPQPPANMAIGGSVPTPVMNHPFQAAGDRPLPFMAKDGGSDNAPMNNDYSDNGATDFSIDNIQQLALGGGVQRMSEGEQPKPTPEQRKEIAKRWAGQLHYEAAPPMSRQDIEGHADRMTAQIMGIDNPHGKTKQQLEREKSLKADIRYKKMKNIPDVDYSKLKNAFMVGIPGDPTIGGVIPVSKMKKRFSLQMPTAGATLRAIDSKPLESPVPLYGGTRYGAYGGENGWASDLGASRGLFNVVQKLHEEDPSREIYGNTHRMSNESANHAIHMLDSAISHMRPHAQPKDHVDYLNNLVRNVRTSTNDIGDVKPHFVGFENPNDLMLQASMDAKLRKKILGILATNKHFPGGKQMIDDIYFSISHPELRNLEVGTAGHGVLKFDPNRKLEDEISQHPTYAHDIPSSLIGKSRYPIPLAIAAPRSMQRSFKKAKEMGLTLAQPFNDMSRSIIREPVDEQYINQLGEYEMAMKKRLGYKKGGDVKSSKVTDNLDTMRLALTRNKKAK